MTTSKLVGIQGTGVYFPKRKVSIERIAKEYRLDHMKLVKEYGINEIHVADSQENEIFMAVKSVEDALRDANITPDKIDLVIYCKGLRKKGSLRNYSSWIIEHINAVNAYGFDIDSGFIGGLIGIHIANDIISNSFYMNNALVIGSQDFDEMYFYRTNSRRVRYMVFGDGAATVILGKDNEKNKILTSNFIIDHYTELIDELLEEELNEKSKLKKFMKLGFLSFGKNIGTMKVINTLNQRWVENTFKVIESCMSTLNLDLSDIDHLIKSHLSSYETEMLAKKLCIEQGKIFNASVEKGHLGHADILSNIHLTMKCRELKNLDIIVVAASNYDCSSGALVLRR